MTRARQGRDFIARHGKTVFNAAHRLQGEAPHTPLTRAGFAQADEMGRALLAILGPRPTLTLWASPTGRALQTLAVIVEHLGLDWHAGRTDPRLGEIGMGSWGGRYYADVIAAEGSVILAGGVLRSAPDGESYPAVAVRVAGWLADTASDPGDRLVVMHGLSSRVLRGVMTGGAARRAGGCALGRGIAARIGGARRGRARDDRASRHGLRTGMMLAALALAMKIGAAGTGATRESLGVFGDWGAFRYGPPDRCVATAVPARTGRHPTWHPFASVALWPGRHRRDVLFVRLSAVRAAGTPVTLGVGNRRFRLIGEGSGAWSPDPATDRALVAALRGEHSLSIAAVSARGEPFADTYLLAGAATAIDAAALGCSGSGDPPVAK